MSNRYIIFVIDEPNNLATAEEILSIDTFNEKLEATGSWITAGGIHSEGKIFLVDNRENVGHIVSESLFQGNENYTGFWIIESESDEHALELAKEASRACNRRVELRPYLR